MAKESNTHDEDNQSNGKRTSKFRIVGLCLLAVGVFANQGLIATKSSAQLRNFINCQFVFAEEFYTQNVVWQGGQNFRFSRVLLSLNENEYEAGVARMVKRIFRRIDATAEQEQQIAEILVAAMITTKPIRDSLNKSRSELRELLSTDTIDRIAIDKIRTERLAEIDTLSKYFTIVFAQVADVLTVEQRQIFNEKFASTI